MFVCSREYLFIFFGSLLDLVSAGMLADKIIVGTNFDVALIRVLKFPLVSLLSRLSVEKRVYRYRVGTRSIVRRVETFVKA